MTMTKKGVNNCSDLISYLSKKAARSTNKRFVVFTKKYLEHEFVHMMHTEFLEEALDFFNVQDSASAFSSPRVLFDQKDGKILGTRNDELVLETMTYISKRDMGKKYHYPFRCIGD